MRNLLYTDLPVGHACLHLQRLNGTKSPQPFTSKREQLSAKVNPRSATSQVMMTRPSKRIGGGAGARYRLGTAWGCAQAKIKLHRINVEQMVSVN